MFHFPIMPYRSLVLALLVAGCQQSAPPTEKPADAPDGEYRAAPSEAPPGPAQRDGAENVAKTASEPIAATLIRDQWRKAENKGECAPLAFTDNGGAEAAPRVAIFGGGWAVAFDQPQKRSLYGVAGTGVEVGGHDAEVDRLRAQWPYGRALGGGPGRLPKGAFAGYGVEGGTPYPATNATGAGSDSLAYVVIPGQRCLYNIWSKVSRRHLETLLDGLTLLNAD